MNPFIGEIIMFGGNFAPRGWAFCSGQLLPISQYTALFSILGTTYGGDGRTTFALPDLRGRVAIAQGRGPGLSNYSLGQRGGTETNTLTVAQMPSHNHIVSMPVSTDSAEENAGYLGSSAIYTEDPTAGKNYPGVTVANTGSGTPVNNMGPFAAVSYIIALVGVFPSRN
jgi:microcystin-dependent protein